MGVSVAPIMERGSGNAPDQQSGEDAEKRMYDGQ